MSSASRTLIPTILGGLLALLFLLAPASVRAQNGAQTDPVPAEKTEAPEPVPTQEDSMSSRMAGYLDNSHGSISHSVARLSAWVDDFFGNERADIESQGTRVRLRTGPSFRDNKLDRFDFNVDVRISLPKAEKKLKIVIEGNSEDTPGAAQDSLQQTVQDTDYSASLFVQFRDELKRNISMDFGARFSIPVDPFARIRVRRSFFPGAWEVRGIASARYFLEAKFETILSLDFDRKLTPRHLFRSRTRGDWTRESEIWNLSHTLALFHTFSDDIGMTTEAAIIWDSAEATLSTENYLTRFKFRQRFFRKWLFWELVPEIQFPRSEGYDVTPILNVKLELIFGKGLSGSTL